MFGNRYQELKKILSIAGRLSKARTLEDYATGGLIIFFLLMAIVSAALILFPNALGKFVASSVVVELLSGYGVPAILTQNFAFLLPVVIPLLAVLRWKNFRLRLGEYVAGAALLSIYCLITLAEVLALHRRAVLSASAVLISVAAVSAGTIREQVETANEIEETYSLWLGSIEDFMLTSSFAEQESLGYSSTLKYWNPRILDRWESIADSECQDPAASLKEVFDELYLPSGDQTWLCRLSALPVDVEHDTSETNPIGTHCRDYGAGDPLSLRATRALGVVRARILMRNAGDVCADVNSLNEVQRNLAELESIGAIGLDADVAGKYHAMLSNLQGALYSCGVVLLSKSPLASEEVTYFKSNVCSTVSLCYQSACSKYKKAYDTVKDPSELCSQSAIRYGNNRLDLMVKVVTMSESIGQSVEPMDGVVSGLVNNAEFMKSQITSTAELLEPCIHSGEMAAPVLFTLAQAYASMFSAQTDDYEGGRYRAKAEAYLGWSAYPETKELYNWDLRPFCSLWGVVEAEPKQNTYVELSTFAALHGEERRTGLLVEISRRCAIGAGAKGTLGRP